MEGGRRGGGGEVGWRWGSLSEEEVVGWRGGLYLGRVEEGREGAVYLGGWGQGEHHTFKFVNDCVVLRLCTGTHAWEGVHAADPVCIL